MMPRISKPALTALIPGLLAVMACTGGMTGHFAPFDSEGWPYGQVLQLEARADSASTGQLMLAVRHLEEYPYRNIWLEVRVGARRPDTVEIELADRYGHWLGTGMGLLYQREVPIGRYVCPDSVIPVAVRHVMRADTLRGIESVGITFIPD